jgi:cell division protein FtsL
MTKKIAAVGTLICLALLITPACMQSGEQGPEKHNAAAGAKAGNANTISQAGEPDAGASRTGKPAEPSISPASGTTKPAPQPLDTNVNRAGESSGNAGTRTSNEPTFSEAVMWILGAMIVVLILGLYIFHLLSILKVKQELAGLQEQLKQTQLAIHKPSSLNPGNSPSINAALENVASQVNKQHQALDQLSTRVQELYNHVAASDKKIEGVTDAVAISAQRASELRIQQEIHRAGGEIVESDRALAARIVERYRDIFGTHLNRVKPLAQELSALGEKITQRPHLPPELVSRIHALLREINQFAKWHAEASDRLSTLQRGSIDERLTAFRSKQRKLNEAFNTREISVVDYVDGHIELLEQYFPERSQHAALLSPADQESELKKISVGAPEYLMDWFDRLFQLQSQLAASQNSVDPRTAEEFAYIQKLASDALGKFDIQPEEIKPGRTSFDNRLYDAALITQSSQFPANTIIGVHQCGFRKLSTGEVLRRPKVVVAGVGVAS